ncbi:MAG: GGDEF domain-containing protein [Chromatiales bacterium]|nr:GGDEF domain-containing protein [Chromatiales bacterium]
MHESPATRPSAAGNPPSAKSVRVALEQRTAVLYTVWAVVAGLAHAAGAVPLPPGAGLVLVLGSVLTLGLFTFVPRRPTAGRPAGDSTLVAGQSLMGIAWATLYIWFAGPSAGAAVLGVGMYLSAIALALPGTSLPVLGRLMVAAGLASLATPLLQQPGLADVGLLTALLPSLVLVVLLTAMHLAARTLAGAREQLQARNAELQAGIERIARRAERDHLTNSYNRQSILEMVGREKARADRSGESLCVCLLDIDHFKDMNDRYGHQAGDRILAAFARRVRGALRTMDVLNSGGVPTATVTEQIGPAGRSALGRVGGEEFIVLLPDTSLRGALRCAERVRKAVVRRPFDGLHQVTVSIGIAEYRPGETVSSLIGRADQALYGAKHAGRNRVHCATTDGGPNAIVMPDLIKGAGP